MINVFTSQAADFTAFKPDWTGFIFIFIFSSTRGSLPYAITIIKK